VANIRFTVSHTLTFCSSWTPVLLGCKLQLILAALSPQPTQAQLVLLNYELQCVLINYGISALEGARSSVTDLTDVQSAALVPTET
jgi:hypothetical protein